MVMRFSERHKLSPSKIIQLNSIDLRLQNRLLNIIRDRETPDILDMGSRGKVEKLLDFLGESYDYADDSFTAKNNIFALKERLVNGEWYEFYDVIERYIALHINDKERKNLESKLNTILEEENSGYRIIKGLITPVVDKEDIKSLEKLLSSPFDATNKHIEKALMLYSDRIEPDYENSIKESISAVEAMCCVITGAKGGEATLGKMLKKLEDKGIYIHGSLKSAFSQLYGFTSDENGIRHGGIDFRNASSEDAYFMLISCSAFINYLKVKYSKIK